MADGLVEVDKDDLRALIKFIVTRVCTRELETETDPGKIAFYRDALLRVGGED